MEMKTPTHQIPTIWGGRGELVFPWSRFWVPSNGAIQLGGSWWGGDTDGFLADPEDDFIGKHGNAHLRDTKSLLKSRPGCIVLWGDPGMGKSRVLTAYHQGEPDPNRVFLEFRDISTLEQFRYHTLDSDIWKYWRSGNHLLTVVVDGVDEGLVKIDGFVGALVGLLRTEPLARLQLVLACRSQEWPVSEGERLMALWPRSESEKDGSGVFELCPLREKDARLAAKIVFEAKTSSANGDKFLREVKRHRLIGLASRPLTLKMLLQEFMTAGGKFPNSHRELYHSCAKTLCAETNTARRERLRNKATPRLLVSDQQRARVAGRIAALMLLCGRSAIVGPHATASTDTSDLLISEIATGTETTDEVPFLVTTAVVEAVLETPLFWPKTDGRIGFYHQTFAECLAAEYLGRLPFAQIRSVLFQRDSHGEHVHPQLAELAAWIAGESDQLLAHLLAHDPEVLLRSDATKLNDQHKAALVSAVLAKAKAAELFDGTGVSRFFHTLRHPGLSDQLRQTLHDRSANHVARRLALSIAESCRLEDMLDDALTRLMDPQDRGMHSLAAGSLDELATPTSVAQLAPLLTEPSEQRNYSTNERLSILHALLKHGFWSLSQAVPYIAASLSSSSLSGHILVQHAKPEDAEALLRACITWRGCFDSLSKFHPLIREAHNLGVARIREPRIRLLLARVWWQARRRHQHNSFTQDDNLKTNAPLPLPEVLRRDDIVRMRFISDLMTVAMGNKEERGWSILELTKVEDFPAFIEGACIGSRRRRKLYAQLASHSYSHALYAAHSDLVIRGLQHSQELREQFPWMRQWTLGAADSLEAAKQHREHEKLQRELEIRRTSKPKPAPEQVWQRDLAYLKETHPPTHWMTLADNLSYRAGAAKSEIEKRHDIQTSPGWLYHDDESRRLIIEGARRLILEEPGNPQHDMGGQSDFDHLAYKALFLLRKEIENDRALAKAVRTHWLPSIFDEFSDTDKHHLEMMAIGYRLDPDRMRALLREKMIRSAARDEDYCLVLREFTLCWDASLATFVTKILVNEIRNPNTIRSAVEHLAEHDSPGAFYLWRTLKRKHRKQPRSPILDAATAALAGARLFDYWEDLWPLLTREPGLAHHVFLTMDRNGQRGFIKKSTATCESRLASLYLYLLELFPKKEDPPIPMGRSYSPSRRMDIARLRDDLPGVLAAVGTAEAVGELQRIAHALPAKDALWIHWKRQDALVVLRRTEWRPPEPAAVLALVQKSESRWITDEDDLMSLVLESLARLETNLRQRKNSWRDLFWEKRKTTKSKTCWQPVGEVRMSELIVKWLEVDLAPNKGLSVLRELQIQHNKRTDIEIAAVAIGTDASKPRPIEIVIEVKGHWHTAIKTAHRDQLVADYLKGCGRTHGIYLIVWTKSDADTRKSKLKAVTTDAARKEIAAQVSDYDGRTNPEVVTGFILDARLA
jgi:hypothetical protein